MTTSVIELATTGRTGELRFGNSIADIIRAIGEPDDRLASDPSALIKYGDFELIFHQGLLAVIHCEYGFPPLPGTPDGARLGIDSTAFGWPLDLESIEAAAARHGLRTSRSQDSDSVTATIGPIRLVIDHLEQVAALSIRQRLYAEPLADGWTIESIDQMLDSGDIAHMHEVPIAVSLNPPDCEWSLDVCIKLAVHPDPTIRGNAALGFGHLARTCPDVALDDIVAARLAAALDDTDSYVAGQALSAHEDIIQFRGLALCESPGGAVWFAPMSGDTIDHRL